MIVDAPRLCECCRRRPATCSQRGLAVCDACADGAPALEPVRTILPRVLAQLPRPTEAA